MTSPNLARFDPFHEVLPADAPVQSSPFLAAVQADTAITNLQQMFLHRKAVPPSVPMPFENPTPLSKTLLPEETLYGETPQRGKVIPLIPPKLEPPAQNFRLLQKWEGLVLQVRDSAFVARLADQTHNGPDEEAEIPLAEVSQGDQDLVQPGAIFYWSIGYLDTHGGQRTRASVIRFRRLPAWTAEELEAAKRKAADTRDLLGWK
jgi:hypothetical protein